MTLKEIEDKITFSVKDRAPYVELRADLSIFSSVYVTDMSLQLGHSDLKAELFKKAKEQLLRDLYADRRREAYVALERVLAADPMNYRELSEARSALISAVHRQIPDYI